MQNFKFSGHETFICRTFWLKKGVDHIINNRSFTDEQAVVDLGIGKNMVASIPYWLKAFNIIDENSSITKFGEYLFHEDIGIDPYLEDIGSIWLLHYMLVKNEYASIYSLFFNEFRKERFQFTQDQFLNFLKRSCEEKKGVTITENTFERDISVFLRLYKRTDFKNLSGEFEDELTGILIDLQLIDVSKTKNIENSSINYYSLESSPKENLPDEIVLFNILDNFDDQKIITLKELETTKNSPGLVFALTPNALYDQIKRITELYPSIILTEDAGKQVLSFKEEIDKWDVLRDYYAN
jgi:hypothetical protein